jgi:hypothetical protein
MRAFLWAGRGEGALRLAGYGFIARSLKLATCPLTPSVGECRAIQEQTGNRTMTKTTKKTHPATRPSVDALQYEKLALSAHNLCDRQLDQLRRLAILAASICRSPSMTREERQSQKALLELLVETAEGYEREIECDRELYQVIALDAKGVPHSRITANVAAKLLSEAAQVAGQGWIDTEQSMNATRKSVLARPTASAGEQQAAVQH